MSDAFTDKIRDLNDGDASDDATITPSAWDSVDVLDLIAAIDETYSVTVPVESLMACTTVGQLRSLIHEAGAA